MVSGVGLEIATLGGYTIAFGFHESVGLALMASGCAQAMSNAKDVSVWKNKEWRTEPQDLSEQLTLEDAKAGGGKEIDPKKLPIKDSRYPKEDGAKKVVAHERPDENSNIEIHYWENRHTGEGHGFKFKNEPPKN